MSKNIFGNLAERVCLCGRKFRAFFTRRRWEAEMKAELEAHLELEVESLKEQGLSETDARREALRRFGGVEQVKELCRDEYRWAWVEQCVQETKLALRSLAKSPIFSIVAVLSLALGIGANTAVFSIVNAILLRSLPVPNPHELSVLNWEGYEPRLPWYSGSLNMVSANVDGAGRKILADAFPLSNYEVLRKTAESQADVFGFYSLKDAAVRTGGAPIVANGLFVTDNFFDSMQVQPGLGRFFRAGDPVPELEQTLVMSYSWWTREFGAARDIVGKSLELNGQLFMVIGVTAPGFTGVNMSGDADFYVPVPAMRRLGRAELLSSPEHWWLHILVRNRVGTGSEKIGSALDAAFGHSVEGTMKKPKLRFEVGHSGFSDDRIYYKRPLTILLCVVGMVVLVASANLAGLLFTRGAAKQHELAVRAALGAGSLRLVRETFAECLLLSLAGGALGLLLATWGKHVLGALLVGSVEGLRYDLSMDLRVFLFTLLLTCLTALLTGLLPAWRASKVDPSLGLKAKAGLGNPKLRLGKFLVAAQLAFSLLLIVAAGLYTRTLLNVVSINPGFTVENVLIFKLSPGAAGIKGAANVDFYARVAESLARVPGVESVGLSHQKLLSGMMSGGSFFTLPSRPDLVDERAPEAHNLTVSEGFFPTMHVPLVLGRSFTPSDTTNSAKVILVNQTFVRKYFGEQNPIGQTIKVEDTLWSVVGVCADSKYEDLKADTPPVVYFSYRQELHADSYFVVRTAQPPQGILSDIRRAVSEVSPDVPVADVSTQQSIRDQSIGQERMFAYLVGGLAGLTVILSCIGLYGLMSYTVSRRTNEFGVRMALGATPREITWPVLRDALVIVAAGLCLGIPLVCLLVAVVRNQLFGISPLDPVSIGVGVLLILCVTLLASIIPACRAARVDPLAALRNE